MKLVNNRRLWKGLLWRKALKRKCVHIALHNNPWCLSMEDKDWPNQHRINFWEQSNVLFVLHDLTSVYKKLKYWNFYQWTSTTVWLWDVSKGLIMHQIPSYNENTRNLQLHCLFLWTQKFQLHITHLPPFSHYFVVWQLAPIFQHEFCMVQYCDHINSSLI